MGWRNNFQIFLFSIFNSIFQLRNFRIAFENSKIRNLKIAAVFFAILLMSTAAYATSSSNNFRIDEDFIGGGGLNTESSTNFKAGESIGDIGIGNSSSTNFQSQSGFTTTNDPTLTFIVNTASVNLGNFSAAVAAKGTATFSVYNYTSFGYIVQITGSTIHNGAYNIPAMAANAASSPGTEQFGINLVANTTPSVGADPVQQPSAGFSSGSAATNYNTANSYRYVSGDTVAQATKTSGKTDFTISFLVNAKSTTPANPYTTSQTLICTGTY